MENPRHWRLQSERYNLRAERCPNPECGTVISPPRDVCPNCHGEVRVAEDGVILSGRGEVYSFTEIQEPPAGYEKYVPYHVALVKLEEGPLVTAQLTDLDGKPVIGMLVEMVTRKLRTDGPQGMIIYGPKFRPLIKAEDR